MHTQKPGVNTLLQLFFNILIMRRMASNQAFNEKQRRAARPRALKMLRMRDQKKTWREIGEAFGVTAQRAEALAKAHRE